MNRQQITYFNLFSLICVIVLLLVDQLSPSSPLILLQRIISAYIILLMPGVNITYLTEKIIKRSYDLPVFLNLSLLSSILIPPFLLITSSQYLRSADIQLTLSVYLSFLILPHLWHAASLFLKHQFFTISNSSALSFPSISIPKLISHPVFIAVVIITIAHQYNLTRYSFLPVPDTYSWLINFEGNLPNNDIPLSVDVGRRSFSAFIAAFFYLGKINLYNSFKYFLPFLSMLIIPPLWLMARQLSNKTSQLIFLLSTAFISPTIILEFEFIRQQVIFLIFLYFSIGLQTYSIYKKDPSIFYLIGIFSLFGTTIHPAFLILSLLWIFALVLPNTKTLWRHKNMFIPVAIIAFPLAKKLHIINMFIRIREQASASFNNFLSGNWNMRFPTYYISSDTYEMSWPGITGALKYYAYYAGPTSLMTLLIFTLLLLFSQSFRKNLFSLLAKAPFLNMLLPFVLFFFISEIAPRFGNIAFLPDRAWQYLSILITFPLIIILLQTQHYSSTAKNISLHIILILTTSISLSGAIYVNNLTKYTMPDYEQVAAKWILQNTKFDSYIYSSSSKNIIQYHAQRNFIGFKDNFYNDSNPNNILNHISSQLSLESDISSNLTNVSGILSDIKSRAISAKADLSESMKYRRISLETYDTLEATFQNLNQSTKLALDHVTTARNFHTNNILGIDNLPPIYIYYAQTHPKNPYSSRPYKSSFTANLNIHKFGALDDRTDIFERVYTDTDKVAIWRIKTNSLNSHDLPVIAP